MIRKSNQHVEVLERQSLLDITIQQTGDLDAIFKIVEIEDISMTDDLTAGGDPIECNFINNKPVADYYRINHIRPATSITLDELNAITGRLEGIDYWIVEDDFVVQ